MTSDEEYEAELLAFFKKLHEDQVALDPEAAEVLYNNLWELYG